MAGDHWDFSSQKCCHFVDVRFVTRSLALGSLTVGTSYSYAAVGTFDVLYTFKFRVMVVQPSGCDIKQMLKYTEKISMVPVQG